MIVGLGVDVLVVSRMEREFHRDPAALRDELFSPREQADCDAQVRPACHYAARFAAKEALLKALDASVRDGASWRETEVIVGASGQPSLRLHGRLRRIADDRRVRRAFVALSHSTEFAAAMVVLEGNDPDAALPPQKDPDP